MPPAAPARAAPPAISGTLALPATWPTLPAAWPSDPHASLAFSPTASRTACGLVLDGLLVERFLGFGLAFFAGVFLVSAFSLLIGGVCAPPLRATRSALARASRRAL